MSKIGPARIKEALGKLFMKIHPDLLWADPVKRKVNEQSMQGLNEILAWEKGLRKGNVQQAPQTAGVVFHTKDEEKVVGAELKLPEGFTPDPHNIPQASAAVNAFLNKLLVSAEVLSSKDQAVVEESSEKIKEWKEVSQKKINVKDYSRDYTDAEWEQLRKEKKIMSKYEGMGDFGAAFDGQDLEVYEGAHEEAEGRDVVVDSEELKVPVQPIKRVMKHKPRAVLGHLADDFNNMMQDFWKPEDVPDVAELISSDLIHYDQGISPVDCAKAIGTLRDSLPELRYDKWYFVPLYITSRFGVESDLPGFISIPYWFEPHDFLSFIAANESHIRSIQEESFRDAKGLESLLKATRDSVPLKDIVVRCDLEHVKPALLTIQQNASMLRESGLRDMVVEIVAAGWQYGARDTGVVQVPADADTEGLREFVDYLNETDQLKPIKQAYTDTVQRLDEIDRLMRVCYEVINPRIIDLESEQATLDDKLDFMSELYSISGELSKYDWTEYTFALGPLDLDWHSGVLSLPSNFHGENFAQTVHMLHEQDNKDLEGQGETPEPETLALDLEAKRIKAELIQTGLLELDPEKQTEQQKTLLRLIETYDTEENIQEFIKEAFPSYVEKQTEHTAVDMGLLAQQRTEVTGYTAKKLRRYFKNKSRARIGPDHKNWDFL